MLLLVGLREKHISPCSGPANDEWEDLGRESGGWEWIDGDIENAHERNEFGGM